MVAHARRTVLLSPEALSFAMHEPIGTRHTHDGVVYEFVHDNELGYYWLPLHPLTLYGEAMRDLQQLLNDRRKLDAQTSATDDTQAS